MTEHPPRHWIVSIAALVWTVIVLGSYYSANIDYYRSQFAAFSKYIGL